MSGNIAGYIRIKGVVVYTILFSELTHHNVIATKQSMRCTKRRHFQQLGDDANPGSVSRTVRNLTARAVAKRLRSSCIGTWFGRV